VLIPGQYEVFFERNVRDCSYTATLGMVDDAPVVVPAGFIGVAPRNNKPTGVYVDTRGTDGNNAARSFYLQVICAR
jgi:hypothetical protein